MSTAPTRIQQMQLMLEPYTFELIHINGKLISLADCLNRMPLTGQPTDVHMHDDLMVCTIDTFRFQVAWQSQRCHHQRCRNADAEEDYLRWMANREVWPSSCSPSLWGHQRWVQWLLWCDIQEHSNSHPSEPPKQANITPTTSHHLPNINNIMA